MAPTSTYAHEEHAAVAEAAHYEPSARPDRVVLTWSSDPATSVDVNWRTDSATTTSVVEYAQAASLVGNLRSGDVEHASVAKGSHQAFKSDVGECNYHNCQLSGLAPATMYAYRAGDGKEWSEWFQFRTAADKPASFTFVYFGDAQNAVRSMWSRVVREANQHAPRADFMLHAGDLVNRGNRDVEWGEWFGAGGWLNGMIPVVATPGNHEYDDVTGLARSWRPQFSFPKNGPPSLEETAYWFDYQGARFISLNSNEQVQQQTAWLASVLNDPNRPKWTIATFHHPIYSAAKERDNKALREAWRPLLEENGVDLVLTGHDHAYARSGLGGPTNVPEGVRQQSSNTVYVVSVSGPKQYPLQEAWEVSRVASGVQLFQVIHVSPERIDYEARLATGELYDAFRLTKNAAGKSVLTDRIPEGEEIRE